jgi:hypothetical protein
MHFKGDKNPQHAFLRRGSKAGGSVLKDITACKNHFEIMNEIFRTPNPLFPSPVSSAWLYVALLVGFPESVLVDESGIIPC